MKKIKNKNDKVCNRLLNTYTIPKLLIVSKKTNLYCDGGSGASFDGSCVGGSCVSDSNFCVNGASNSLYCMFGESANDIFEACEITGNSPNNTEPGSNGS